MSVRVHRRSYYGQTFQSRQSFALTKINVIRFAGRQDLVAQEEGQGGGYIPAGGAASNESGHGVVSPIRGRSYLAKMEKARC